MASNPQNGGEELSDRRRKNILALRILRTLWSSQIDALKDVLGAKQTVDLLTPFFLRMSNSGTLQIMDWVGVKDKGIEDLGRVASIQVPINLMFEVGINVHEDGMSFVGLSECPYKNASKEICLLQDRATATGSLEAFDLENDFEFTMDFEHPCDDRYCKSEHFFVLKGSDRPKGKIIANYSTEELRVKYGQDWMDDLSIQYKAEFFVQTTNMAIEELETENAESVLLKAADEVGKEIAEIWRKEDLAKAFDVKGVIELLAILGDSMKQGSEIARVGKNNMMRKVRSCPFSDSNPLVCAQLEAFTSRLCSELFPGTSYETRKVMTKGDDHCSFGVKVSKLDGDEMDPLQILKIRFAKGEISEMEYLRMRNLLID